MPCPHNKEKPIDFWLRKGKAVGETKPTETIAPAQKIAPAADIVVLVLRIIKPWAKSYRLV